MTGHGSAAGALDATALGAYDYLLKPFGVRDVEELSEAVRRHLERHRHTESDEPIALAYTSELQLACSPIDRKSLGRIIQRYNIDISADDKLSADISN